MKKYIKATVSVVEVMPVENIALNPIDAIESVGDDGFGRVTTVYDISKFNVGSV